MIDWRVAAEWYKRMNEKREYAGLLAHIGEDWATSGKIKLGYERDRLRNLCTNGLFIWVGRRPLQVKVVA